MEAALFPFRSRYKPRPRVHFRNLRTPSRSNVSRSVPPTRRWSDAPSKAREGPFPRPARISVSFSPLQAEGPSASYYEIGSGFERKPAAPCAQLLRPFSRPVHPANRNGPLRSFPAFRPLRNHSRPDAPFKSKKASFALCDDPASVSKRKGGLPPTDPAAPAPSG